jgi:excisionase family DNA binding protein
MSAAGFRVLDLLTVGDAAARLGCSADKVRRLVEDDVLKVERYGRLVRVTPESVAAYEQHLIAEAQAAKAS